MKLFPRIILVALVLVMSAFSVFGQDPSGCCCNTQGFAQDDTYRTQSQCLSTFPVFILPTIADSAAGKTCSVLCGENSNTTPVQSGACGSPDFKPPPKDFLVNPIKGVLALKLVWAEECPAQAYTISRCAGATCTNFVQIAIVGPSTSFTDGSTALRWNSVYSYRMTAKYSIQGDSAPVTDSENTGDLECENQFGENSFCISNYSYLNFKTYLQSFGYAGTTPITPASAFGTPASSPEVFMNAVTGENGGAGIFFNKVNAAGICNSQNKLTLQVNSAGQAKCAAGSYCVVQGTIASCKTPGPCDPNQGIFGLGATVSTCEGVAEDANYCFLDRSSTPVNECYQCSQALSCYDYKSEGACSRNNCGLGSCKWNSTFGALGLGVCFDERYSNCALCAKSSSILAPNQDAYNQVFDKCTQEKASALSNSQYPCFYNPGTGTAQDCNTASCKDYTQQQCGSPIGGVTLDTDNSIISGSADPCQIKVCQYDQTLGCLKNADGTPVTQFWRDCGPNDIGCERDYIPPLTTAIPTGGVGKFEYLDLRIWDKSNKTDFGKLILPAGNLQLCIGQCTTNIPQYLNWSIFLCAYPQDGTECTTFAKTNYTQLNFNDLNLKQGSNNLLTLTTGWNTLRYYTQDPMKNLEVVKELQVYACDACQGPDLLSLTISQSNYINGTYYTRTLSPSAAIEFTEEAEIVFAGFIRGSTPYEMQKTPSSGLHVAYALALSSGTQLAEGSYIFSANSYDNNNVYMDTPVSIPVVVDITPPIATFSPVDGTVLGSGTSVQVKINFSEPVLVQGFMIEEYEVYQTPAGPISVPVLKNYTNKFVKGNDNRTYTATLSFTEGKKVFKPQVTDYAGNPLSAQSSFSQSLLVINALPPVITLKQPKFGVSDVNSFPFAVETDSIADCRYWSSQTLPPPGAFSGMQPFDSTNAYDHIKNVFDEIKQVNVPYKINVRCQDALTGISTATFYLTVDKSPPKILQAFASPATIVQIPLQTTLKVQTDDLTFCKYSDTTSNYDAMTGEFPLFNILGRNSHAVNVTVPLEAAYTYTVACKNLAGLGPASKTIQFTVDLSQSLTITSLTPQYHGNLTVPLGVETNKDTFCYYEENGVLLPVGQTNSSAMAHFTSVSVDTPGWHELMVHCSTGAGTSQQGIEEASLLVRVFVDLTPPVMTYADDTSNNPLFPQFSYFTNQLRVAMLGLDNDSNVSRYWYTIEQKTPSVIVKNWTPSVILTGKPWYSTGLNLSNGTSYFFRVKAENRAALRSNEMLSDGVTIDINKIPPHCIDSEKNDDETDVDCGGSCPQCADFLTCAEDIDCLSRICNATMICQPSLCDDTINGGNETDIDCGGNKCSGCENNQTCAMNTDCVSNYCDAGVCSDDPCRNGMLNGLESDVDCGGACAQRCLLGQTCVVKDDCAADLMCVNNVCLEQADEDGDGIPDDEDQCPGTPIGEIVDEFGCSASQRYSCGDEIPDSWRIQYFGDVFCDDEYAAEGDFDGDGISNRDEFLDGTDPTVSDRTSIWWWVLIILLIGAIVAGFWYHKKHPGELNNHFQRFKKQMQSFVKPEAPSPVPKEVAKDQPQHIENWLSMSDLKKLGPEDMSAKTFGKLDSLIKGDLAEKEHAKLLKQMEKERTPLDRLREMALAGLSAKDRKDLLLKLRLLRQGKLTKEEMEELFRKLRITAAYYSQHKTELEAELEVFVRGERVRKRKK